MSTLPPYTFRLAASRGLDVWAEYDVRVVSFDDLHDHVQREGRCLGLSEARIAALTTKAWRLRYSQPGAHSASCLSRRAASLSLWYLP